MDGKDVQALRVAHTDSTGSTTDTIGLHGKGRWRSNKLSSKAHVQTMRLFANQVGQQPSDDDDDSSEEGAGCFALKRVTDPESILAAVNKQELERLQYPTSVDSGPAGRVLPSHWRPDAQRMESEQQRNDYSAATVQGCVRSQRRRSMETYGVPSCNGDRASSFSV